MPHHSRAAAFALLISLFLLPGAARAQPRFSDTPDFKGLRERWEPLLEEFEVPGMAVAVVKNGKIHAVETFGVRAPGGPAPTPDTMYYIASITKTYLATAICALADDGKLSLDDPVKKYLPRFALADGSEGTITIRDLLSHKPGIDSTPIVVLDAFSGEITEDRYYTWLAAATPRHQINYSNVHFTILGRVVEAVSGKPWRDYLQERIFTPAGLKRTTGYADRMYADADCALPMERFGGAWRECRLKKTDRTMHAAGGLGTSAVDAARYLILQMNDGEIDGKRVLSAERAREMRTLTGAFDKTSGSIRVMQGFGLGWQVGTFHGQPLCSHGGGYTGASAYYAMLPAQKAGFVLLMNTGGGASLLGDVLAVDILDRLLDGDEKIDVLEAYRRRAAEVKPSVAQREREFMDAVAKAPSLSLPPAAYVGQYRHKDLGTITVRAEKERLAVSLGECPLDVTGADLDQARVIGQVADGLVLTFVVGSDRTVKEIKAAIPDLGEYAFVR